MKRLILSVAAAVIISAASSVAIASSPTQTNSIAVTRDKDNSKYIVLMNGDTVLSTDGISAIGSKLNDTLLSTTSVFSYDKDDDYDNDNETYLAEKRLEYEYEFKSKFHRVMFPVIILSVICGTVFLIILICLIISYMNRRNRNRVIEKAIEKGYNLPDSFYTGRQEDARQQFVVTEYSQPTQPMPNAAQDGSAPQQSNNYQTVFRYLTDKEIKNASTLIIVSLALVIFFVMIGGAEIAALMLIPLFIGVSKIVFPYLRRRSMVAPSNMQQPPVQPQQPAQPQQPVQPTVEPQTNNTVPPEFNQPE